MRVFGVLFACLTLLTLGLLKPVAAQGSSTATQDKDANARAAIVAYSANLSAFPFYKCRYRHSKGESKSLEDAIQGKLYNVQFHDNRQIVDGDKYLSEGLAPPPNLAQKQQIDKGKFIVRSPGNSAKYLAGGENEMNYQPALKTINLYSAGKSRHGVITPTLLGIYSLGHRSANGPDTWLASKDRYEFSVVGPEEVLGRAVITVRFKDKKTVNVREGPLQIAKTFSFDPGKGHLPIRVITYWNDRPITHIFVTHVRECSKQRWFPERVVAADTRKDGLYDVQVLDLLEIDVDQRPKADEFSFTIPAGTSVREYHDAGRSFRLKQEEKISIDDIPTLFKMLEKVQQDPLMDTSLSGHKPWGWGRWALAAAGLCLAIGSALVVVQRRIRARKLAT